MKILIACEESQRVCTEFRKKGHEAYSCDIVDTSGDHPEWHLKQDVIPLLSDDWDMVIAFPPCTHLAVSGARWFAEKRKDGRQQEGIDFFMKFTELNHIPKVVIENPIGIMSTYYRKPDQIIQPYQFGDPHKKSTCLWLKGLPLLKSTVIVEPSLVQYRCKSGKIVTFDEYMVRGFKGSRSEHRSRTFKGIAQAMADQWG